MGPGNTIFPPSTGANSSQALAAAKTSHVASAVLLFATVLVGVAGNGLCLWVLGLKMRRTVTTLWFLHLVSSYLLIILLVPFLAVYLLLGFHWVFGTAMCKLVNTCISMGMFSSVFLLAFISLDRYILTCHPIWSRCHRTLPLSEKLVIGVWLVSFTLSTPYLAFRKTHEDKGRILCDNNYTLSGDWNGANVHLAIFIVQFLLSFVLPFCIITGCYVWMGLEMKVKGLAQSGKPFKVMVASVVSFFLCWLPYHIYYGLKLAKNMSPSVTDTFLVIFVSMFCFNVCFTPVIYLFIGETFQQVIKTSLFALVKRAFDEDLSINGSGSESTGKHGQETGSMEMEKN